MTSSKVGRRSDGWKNGSSIASISSRLEGEGRLK
jgi:hypothetical protein